MFGWTRRLPNSSAADCALGLGTRSTFNWLLGNVQERYSGDGLVGEGREGVPENTAAVTVFRSACGVIQDTRVPQE